MVPPEVNLSTAVTRLSPHDHGLPAAASTYLPLKRGFDVINAALQLLLFSPLMLLVALAIKLYDRGPVKGNMHYQPGILSPATVPPASNT